MRTQLKIVVKIILPHMSSNRKEKNMWNLGMTIVIKLVNRFLKVSDRKENCVGFFFKKGSSEITKLRSERMS